MTTPPPYPAQAPQNPYYPPLQQQPQQPQPQFGAANGYWVQPTPQPVVERRPVIAIVALVLAAVVFAGTMLARLVAATVSADVPIELIAGLGGASFLSLLLIVPALVLAHLAVNKTARGARVGRGMAVGALVLAYVDLSMFLIRVIAATIAPGGYGQPTDFFVNLFFWA
jgi:hypothetical protein